MSELKVCPHCGSKAIVVEDNSAWKVFCTSPDCDAQYGWCASREYAIKGWNRRIEDAPTIELKCEIGEWIPYTYVDPDDWYQDKEIRYRCSKCGAEVINESNFCPNCGADMRKKERREG